MNKYIKITLLISILCSSISFAASENKDQEAAIAALLKKERKKTPVKTSNISLYKSTKDSEYSGFAAPNTVAVTLDVAEIYAGNNYCYLSCLTKKQSDSIITLDKVNHIAGLLKVKGSYYNSDCMPYGSGTINARSNRRYKAKCAKFFKSCANKKCKISTHTKILNN